MRLLGLLAAIGAVAVAFVVWLLFSGPISLAWLTPYLEDALAEGMPVGAIEIDATALRLGADRLPEFVALGVHGRGPDGRLTFQLSEIEIGLSAAALLGRGMVAVERLEARAPRLYLTRRADGSIGLGGVEQGDGRDQLDLAILLSEFLQPSEPGDAWSYVEQIRISGGSFVFEDRLRGETLEGRDAEVVMRHGVRGVEAMLDLRVEQSGPPALLRVRAVHDVARQSIGVSFEFDDLIPATFAGLVPDLSFSDLEFLVDGTLRGEGSLDGTLSPVRFEVAIEDQVIQLPSLLAHDLPVDFVGLRGALAPDLAAVTVEDLRVGALGASLRGAGEAAWRDARPTLAADLEAENVAAGTLEVFWPPRFGRKARKWVLENIIGGVVPAARASLRFGPGELGQKPLPEASLSGAFTFRDLAVRYLKTMPPLVGLEGGATFDGQRMAFTVTDGHTADLTVNGGAVTITGIGIKGRDTTRLAVDAEIGGPLDQALALIDRPPLEFAEKAGIDPETASGRTVVDLRLEMPLTRDLKRSEIAVSAGAEIADAALVAGPVELEGGAFDLQVDNARADLAGRAVIGGVPLDLAISENLTADAEFERRYQVQGTPDVAVLDRFGLDLPVALGGTVGLDATVTETPGGRAVELALDLTPTAIESERLGWTKPAGEPASLDASAEVPDGGPIRVTDFDLESDQLSAAGTMEIGTDPVQVERMQLSQVRFGASEGTLSLDQDRPVGYAVGIEAETLDLASLLDGRGGAEPEAAPTPLRLGLRAERLILDDRVLTEVDADLVRDAEGWRSAGLTGRLPDGGEVELTLVPNEEGRQLRVTSSDAGDFLETLHQTSRIEGGDLALEATIDRQRPRLVADGALSARNFDVLDAPILARLLTVASLTGISDLLGGEGLHVDRLELRFALRNGRLSIEDGLMSGSELGLTVDGGIDLDARALDLEGTVVPLYTINRAIGRIPILGPLLTGAEGEGAFAASYTIVGPVDDPSVMVNPLTVLAPGFLRELFSGLQEGSLEPPEMLPSHDD